MGQLGVRGRTQTRPHQVGPALKSEEGSGGTHASWAPATGLVTWGHSLVA